MYLQHFRLCQHDAIWRERVREPRHLLGSGEWLHARHVADRVQRPGGGRVQQV